MVNQHSVENDDVDDVVDYSEDHDDDLDDEVAVDIGGAIAAESTDSNIAARQLVREELSRQVAEFLARGGQIREIPSSAQAERPVKPVADFGDRRL